MKSKFRVQSILVAATLFLSTTNVALADGISPKPDAANITITNNAGIADTVKVTSLSVGDVVRVYSPTTQIGTATVTTGKSEAIVSIPQIGTDAGIVYVSVTNISSLESDKVEKAYIAEATSTDPVADNITITNNVTGKADTVKVTGLAAGDVVKVYKDGTATTTLGTATVAATATEATVTIQQLGVVEGSVFITVTSTGKKESTRVEKAYEAEAVTDAVAADAVTVTNNAGKADTVVVAGLVAGDIVKVYKDGTVTTALGTATVATGKTEAIVSITQLGTEAGKVFITVTSAGKLESTRTEVAYAEEATSTAPVADNITVTNNVTGKADTVKVTGLAAGDVVKVYKDGTATTTLGTATVAATATEATVTIQQLGVVEGSVFVTVTSAGKKESTRVEKAYEAEAVTDAVAADAVTVTNNAGKADTIVVAGLVAGDIVKVYKDGTVTTALGTATVATGKTEAIVSITQLGTEAGKVFVTVTSAGKLESTRTEVAYAEEATSTAPVADNITVTNNVTGKADTVKVTGLAAGDVVKVYKDGTATTTLGTATVAATATEATVTIQQLGVVEGSVFVTVTSAGKKESTRVEKAYEAEAVTDAVAADAVTVTNNAGKADTVVVAGLVAGDIVKVYKDGTVTTALGTATVATGKTEAVVSITQLGTEAGKVFVTVTSAGKLESTRTEVAYAEEATSTAPVADNITVTNNVTGKADTVKVTGLAAGDVVKVYKDGTATTTLGTATVAATATEATVTIQQLGVVEGSVFVTVTSAGKKESTRVEKAYEAETVTDAVAADAVTVTNNAGKADTVVVAGLVAGDIVKVYKDGTVTTALGTATVATGKTEAIVSITQLGTEAGKVFVTVTSAGKLESTRTEVAYAEEATSTAPVADNITVTNNVTGKADTVKVTGLAAGDVVKVYKDGTATTTLGTATVAATATEATVTIQQLGVVEGSVFVTVTSAGKKESTRVEKAYEAEAVTDAVAADAVTVTNNAGKADTIVVAGLVAGDIVKVYKDGTVTTALGTATVATGKTEAIVTIAQLGTETGKVFITVTSAGKLESTRTEVAYAAEEVTADPNGDKVLAINNTGNDMVVVYGLTAGDIVNIYDVAEGGKVIGTSTVAATQSQVVITIPQLGQTGGTFYFTVTNSGKRESKRIAVTFAAE
ncbi:hypothetical protein [Clostridium sp. BNL1100]|uniref:hypothetical protein n=1 Tax=Clostridium sp. BNL1100 TaxID=755731 RepID=UPI00024A70F0|nr:hypothetical protein [Clostridium sp. BNL1100]AEY64583.1 hypothetical protein Clo1100_0296 [Clostridium sp. BNL1100]